MNAHDRLIESMRDFEAKDAHCMAVAIAVLPKLKQQIDDILAADERNTMSAPHVQRIEVTCKAPADEPVIYQAAPGGTLVLCVKCGQLVPRSGDELHEIRNIRSNEP